VSKIVGMLIISCMMLSNGVFANGQSEHNNQSQCNEKVVICHIPGGDYQNSHQIEVSKCSLDNHLQHGDHEGECLECYTDEGEACDAVDECSEDLECDNSMWCDGEETCTEGYCAAGEPPCFDECSELTLTCIVTSAKIDLTTGDGTVVEIPETDGGNTGITNDPPPDWLNPEEDPDRTPVEHLDAGVEVISVLPGETIEVGIVITPDAGIPPGQVGGSSIFTSYGCSGTNDDSPNILLSIMFVGLMMFHRRSCKNR